MAASESWCPGAAVTWKRGTRVVENHAYRSSRVGKHCAVRTKPLARQTLRVRVGRGSLFDPLRPPHTWSILLGDAPYLECSQSSLVVHYFQWNIDPNSNNGPRLPKNASGLLQTSLSEVIRRSRSHRSSALTRRITPDRVIASGRI